MKVGDVCKKLKLHRVLFTEALGIILFPVGTGEMEDGRQIKKDWLGEREG